jgi:hypothetical protein
MVEMVEKRCAGPNCEHVFRHVRGDRRGKLYCSPRCAARAQRLRRELREHEEKHRVFRELREAQLQVEVARAAMRGSQ